jgi:hypothetical protein
MFESFYVRIVLCSNRFMFESFYVRIVLCSNRFMFESFIVKSMILRKYLRSYQVLFQ